MKTKVESRRIWLYLIFAFGIAWTFDLAIYLTGGLTSASITSPAGILLIFSMIAPFLAHILTRWLTGEGWHRLYLRPHFKQTKRFWLIAWLGTSLLVLLGATIYFLLFPKYFDPNLTVASKVLAQTAQKSGKSLPLTPAMFVVVQALQAILLAPILNSLATFGEEFGWRAYLLPKLMPLGRRKAMLLLGLIWGVWHWPVILMGYEYGLSYPGFPWLGPLVFLWFTFTVGIFFAWLTLKASNVWPAVIAHAALNGIATIGGLFVQGQPNPLLGPLAVGLLASLPFTVVALWLLWRSDVFSAPQPHSFEQPNIAHAHSKI